MPHAKCLLRLKALPLVALGVALAPGSYAATATAQDAPPSSDRLEEIVVTAQKRSQSLQDVPISVTALRGEQLEERGALGLSEFTRMVPGLSYTDFGPGGQRGTRPLSIRGVDSGANEFTAPSVGYYIDEVPISVADTNIFDLDRIEVLRGPQGTLYGVGTAAGTIKLITNQPDPREFKAVAEGTGLYSAHGDGGGRFNGMVNVPLAADVAALRVSAYYRREPGYIDSVVAPAGSPPAKIVNTQTVAEKDFNDQRVRGVRASLLWQPNDRVSITPSVFLQKNDIGGEPVHAPDASGDLQIARETDTEQATDFGLYALTAKFDLGFADLISVSSHQNNDFEGTEDITDLVRGFFQFALPPPDQLALQVPAPFRIDDQRKQTTQELRLASKGDARLSWLIGTFYQERKERIQQNLVLAGIDAQTSFDLGGDTLAAFDNRVTVREVAAFGEATFDVTERFHATGGLRYFDVDQKNSTVSGGIFFNGGDTTTADSHEHGVRPKVQLSFDVTEDLMVYATAARGFRLGGAVPAVPDTPACRAGLAQLGVDTFPVPSSYDADSVWNYEAGAKSSWAERRLILNTSIYYIRRDDIVQTTTIPNNCGFSVTQNAGEAVSKGVELELSARPTKKLSFDLALGYTDAKLESQVLGNPEARPGDRLVQVPEWTVSAGAEFRQPLNAGTTAFFRTDYQYIGDRTDDFVESNPNHLLASYSSVNVHLGIDRDLWSAALFVTNAGDQRPRLSNWSFGHDYGAFHTMQPRTYGVTLRRSF